MMKGRWMSASAPIVTRNGDVCNKTGTYLKVLAAHDNEVLLLCRTPSLHQLIRTPESGADIPIEERSAEELTRLRCGRRVKIGNCPCHRLPAANYTAFDATPARLVTGYITERGGWTGSERRFGLLKAHHPTGEAVQLQSVPRPGERAGKRDELHRRTAKWRFRG